MSESNLPPGDLPPDVQAEVDRAVESFQDALKRGERPAPESFVPAGPAALAVLFELVHVELEFRLKRGEAARVEEYLARYLQLAQDPGGVVDLVIAEYRFRRRSDPALSWEQFLERFPQYREPLEARSPDVESRAWERAGPDLRDPAGHVEINSFSASQPAVQQVVGLPRVPGYEVLAEVGRGSMGVVYRARHCGLKRLVALKMIHAAGLSDPEMLARFRTEVEVLGRLQHPHIVQIYDVGEYEGRLFFALELLDGGSLVHQVRGGPRPPRAAAALVEKLARAMQTAHALGIVHRNLRGHPEH